MVKFILNTSAIIMSALLFLGCSTDQIELESGDYGRYELAYYITMPAINSVVSSGTGDVFVTVSKSLDVLIEGTGKVIDSN